MYKIYQVFDNSEDGMLVTQVVCKNEIELDEIMLEEYEVNIMRKDKYGDPMYYWEELRFNGFNINITKIAFTL